MGEIGQFPVLQVRLRGGSDVVMQFLAGDPADRPNCIPSMMVARLAHDDNVKGLLSGEGSDEAFLGNLWVGRWQLPHIDVWGNIFFMFGKQHADLTGGIEQAVAVRPLSQN